MSIQSAVSYNKSKNYSKETWKQVQSVIGVTADGIPGAVTAQAVMNWQRSHGLTADGCVGPATLGAIQKSGSTTTATSTAATNAGASAGSTATTATSANFDVDAAVQYNKNRGYSRDLWKQIQAKVGTTADGSPGKLTATAIYNWQKANGLTADGQCGAKTLEKMGLKSDASSGGGSAGGAPVGNDNVDASEIPAQSTVRSGKSIYGKPCSSDCQARLTLPYTMYADYGSDGLGKLSAPVKSIPCHKLLHNRIYNIFKETLEVFGAENIHKYRLDVFSGAYVAKSTGTSGSNANASANWSKLSMHAWGVAMDVDGGHNPNRVDKNNVDWLNVNSAKGKEHNISKFWDIVAKYGGYSLGKQSNKDWMHFQFASFK